MTQEGKKEKFSCTQEKCIHQGKFFEQKELEKKNSYFLRIPVKDQLLRKLNNASFRAKINRDSEEGVCGGEAMKNLRAEGLIRPNDITLQFNTDGVNAYESSNDSIWPIFVSINELPYLDRKKNLILTGLWFGDEEPKMNSFLDAFVHELIDLHHNGLTLKNGMKVKVHCLIGSADSKARAKLQGIQQHNGSHGCSYCLKESRTHWLTDTAHVPIYEGPVGEPRTYDQHLKDAKENINPTKKPNKNNRKKNLIGGVKEVSILMLLPIFCIFRSFVPDYMHNVLLGVVRQYLFGWLSSVNSDKEFYINPEKAELLNQRLLRMMPPDEITRLPRDLSRRKKFKASEFRSFLLHYSIPCLMDILPYKYLQHWSLLVYAMGIYLQPKIDPRDWKSAKEALEEFVYQTYNLYPEEWFTFNVHLLLHVPDFVKLYGGLWDSSCFPYEHYNGVLVNLFHGTRYVGEQIFKNYSRLQYLQKVVDDGKIFKDAHPSVVKLFSDYCGKYLIMPDDGDIENSSPKEALLPLGRSHRSEALLPSQTVALRKILPNVNISLSDKFEVWDRCLIRGMKCSTAEYTRGRRKNNFVQLENGQFLEIVKIISVGGEKVLIGNNLVLDVKNFYCKYPKYLKNKAVMPAPIQIRQISAAFPEKVVKKCVYSRIVSDADESAVRYEFVSQLPNPYERD